MKYELNKDEFQKRLRILMDDNNETIYTISEKLNLSPATISRYSTGKMSPKITTVEVLSHILKVDPAWLMGYAVDKFSKQINQSSKIKAIRVPVLGRVPAVI